MMKTLRLIILASIVLFSFGGRYYLTVNNVETKVETKSHQESQWSIESSRSIFGLASEEAYTALPAAPSCSTMSIQGFGQTIVTRAINRLISNKIQRVEHACYISRSKQPPLFYIFALHKMRD